MEKEFETLPPNVLLEFIDGLLKRHEGEDYNIYITREWLLEIKQALIELKAIKEAEPSEALRYIQQYLNEMTYCLKHPKEYVKNYDKEIFYKYQYTFESVIETALLKAQEQDKVLEIIKEHLPFEDGGIEVVKDFINDKEETKYIIKVISKDTGATIHIHLDTKEESELLKRYLNGK